MKMVRIILYHDDVNYDQVLCIADICIMMTVMWATTMMTIGMTMVVMMTMMVMDDDGCIMNGAGLWMVGSDEGC